MLIFFVQCTPPTSHQQGGFLEATAKVRLRRDLPSRKIMVGASPVSGTHQTIPYHHSLPIPGCIQKHGRWRPKIKGVGETCAVLSDTDTFVALLEYLLCYHAWCHYGYQLSPNLRNNLDTIGYGIRLVVQLFDSILYRGDGTADADTCKIHSQLHTEQLLEYFGDLMQYNTELGERGLKFWAKRISETAQKHGADNFTYNTSLRISEQLLLNAIADKRETMGTNPSPTPADTNRRMRRKLPHFSFTRDDFGSLKSHNRLGREATPSRSTGIIHRKILEGIQELESSSAQMSFDVWCEAQLSNGEYVRCWPQYRQSKGGERYDWVMACFRTEGGGEDFYPAKVLALYEDQDGALKALVHAVDYKTNSRCESTFGTRISSRTTVFSSSQMAPLPCTPLAGMTSSMSFWLSNL